MVSGHGSSLRGACQWCTAHVHTHAHMLYTGHKARVSSLEAHVFGVETCGHYTPHMVSDMLAIQAAALQFRWLD